MSRFTTGLLVGGLTAVLGATYMIQDSKSYNKVKKGVKTGVKKGKHMALRAEEVMDDMLDQLTES